MPEVFMEAAADTAGTDADTVGPEAAFGGKSVYVCQKGIKMGEKRLFTSESVTEGHPDKVCDAISDAILDVCIEQDPLSRVACETAICTGFVLVTGEITTKAHIDYQKIIRDTVNEIGYNDAATGFDGNTCAVLVAMDQQSPDIAMGVDNALETKEELKELETNIRSRLRTESADVLAKSGRMARFPICVRTAKPRFLWNTMKTANRCVWKRWCFLPSMPLMSPRDRFTRTSENMSSRKFFLAS